MKLCCTCKQELPLEQFYKDKTSNDGLGYKCKFCVKQYNKQQNKQWRQDNPEHYKQQNKKWRQDNPEYYKQYNKQYYQDNAEYNKQLVQKYNNSIKPGVYMVKCLLTGNCYVGQSIKPYRRRIEHFSKYQSKKNQTNPKLQADMKQYGKNAFVFGIIEHCESEQLLEREKYWIQNLNPTYNTKLN